MYAEPLQPASSAVYSSPRMSVGKPKRPMKKRIASLEDPSLEAIAEGLFRFGELAQAVSLLDRLGRQYVISKDQERIVPDAPPTLRLWIRGYDVTDDEHAKGFRGHFARLSIHRLPGGGKYTIRAEKQEVALRLHPQKERPKFRHPNMGHPILRAAERGRIYTDITEAREEILRLHEEFPETSIPGRDKLHLMIYSRRSEPPIQKMTLRINAVGEEGFKLDLTQNVRRAAPAAAGAIAVGPQEGEGAVAAGNGKFAALVKLSRKKKPVLAKKKSEGGTENTEE